MMNAVELNSLVLRLQASDVSYIECEGPQGVLCLKFSRPTTFTAVDGLGAGDGSVGEPPPRVRDDTAWLKSPGIGHFSLQHPLVEQPPIREGDQVVEGQLLGFLRVAEVLTPLLAHREGLVLRQAVDDGMLVGYGEALFQIA